MSTLPWLYLAVLSMGYALALTYGQLGLLSAVPVALLLCAG
ncbi:CPBP family intramembrane metalloprotease, partial [Pseudomonas sp. TH05]|nr:CPBP family intramembrane metalloprotease [Pseudomonas sp. TH05]